MIALPKKLTLFGLILSFPFIVISQVLTQHNDNFRTGWNNQEKILHKKNVNIDSFGILFTRSVDDQVYAQPLVAKVNIGQLGPKNVVFIATVNNTIYAFDAEAANMASPYWQVNLTPVGWRPMKNTDTACGTSGYNDFSGNFGIVGTPVIDLASNTIFVLVKIANGTAGSASYQQALHALDLSTGAEKPNSPVTIAAQVTGTGAGSSSGIIKFDPQLENQRCALLLDNGVVYIAWAAHGDCGNYHGWIMGYDKASLTQKYVYNSTPDGKQGGIWMAGSGLSADESGNIYAAVGNGSVGKNGIPSDITNRSESALKLTPSGNTLLVTSFFTPSNFEALEAGDEDFGVTGMMLIPDRKQAVSGAKDGSIYLMNRDTLGGYSSSGNFVIQSYNQNDPNAHNLSSLTYYKGTLNEFVYIWSDNVPLRALPYDANAKKFDLNKIISSTTQGPMGYNGAFMSVSSNNAFDSTAILWVSHAANGCNANQKTCAGILRAFDATDITKELWNSSLKSQDAVGNYAKFNCPTIVNGKIYLATFSNRLAVYGLLKNYVTEVESENSEFKIYPNPVRGSLFIQVKSVPEKMRVLNLNGESAIELMELNSQEIEINVSNLPAGFYIVEVYSLGSVYRQKIIIAN